MRLTFVVLLLLAIAVPLIANPEQSPSANSAANPCTLRGTWYGGSDPIFPFAWTFSPAGANSYTSYTSQGTDFGFLGYTSWTDWTGEATPIGPRLWDSWGISYWIWDPEAAAAAGIDGTLPELDIVHSRIEMIDCDTFVSTIDVYGAYFAWTISRVPFVAPVDMDWLPAGGISETYYRLPRWEDNPQPPGVGNREPRPLNTASPIRRKR